MYSPIRRDHPLDRPVWSALECRQAVMSVGNHLARRYAPGFGPFAATRDAQPGALEALAGLVAVGASGCSCCKRSKAPFRAELSSSAGRPAFRW